MLFPFSFCCGKEGTKRGLKREVISSIRFREKGLFARKRDGMSY
jgi:hypothetical protein